MLPPLNKKQETKSFAWKAIMSAYVSLPRVIITFGAGHPFDLVKTKMQANPNITSGVLLAKDIFQKTGIKGFYTAGCTNLSRSLIKETYRGMLKGGWTKFFQDHLLQNSNYATQKLAGALLTSVCDTIIICPWERLKVWIMTQQQGAKISDFWKGNGQIKNILIKNPNNKEMPIIRNLFKGFTVSATRNAISWSTYILSEAMIREWVIRTSPRINKKEAYPNIPWPESLIVGSLGGIVNGLFTLPLDTIKTNIQKVGFIEEATFAEMFRTGKNLIAKHGFCKGLYPAFIVKLINYSLVGMITSPVIQRLDKLWEIQRPV